jgi:hypothetical protein
MVHHFSCSSVWFPFWLLVFTVRICLDQGTAAAPWTNDLSLFLTFKQACVFVNIRLSLQRVKSPNRRNKLVRTSYQCVGGGWSVAGADSRIGFHGHQSVCVCVCVCVCVWCAFHHAQDSLSSSPSVGQVCSYAHMGGIRCILSIGSVYSHYVCRTLKDWVTGLWRCLRVYVDMLQHGSYPLEHKNLWQESLLKISV